MNDNPIFLDLLKEYTVAGRRLPWVYSVRPTGTAAMLSQENNFLSRFSLYGSQVLSPNALVVIKNVHLD